MLNHITIMGRLTRDPELRRTGNGVAVTSFTVAVDRDIKSSDGETDTDFIDCVAWRQTGEFVGKYFTKGRMAVVSGRLQIRGWTKTAANGVPQKSTRIMCTSAIQKRSCRMIHLHWLPICPLLIRQPDTQRLLPILQCSKTMTHSCLSKILTDAAVNEVTRCACATIR
jgi:hypothetical protein